MFTYLQNFETDEQALEFLTKNKNAGCTTALTNRYWSARQDQLPISLAIHQAQILHAHFDHEAGMEIPDDFPHTTDTEAEEALSETRIEGKGITDEMNLEFSDLVIQHFRTYRQWGVNLLFAGSCAIKTAAEEWYSVPEHNEKVEDARKDIKNIKDDRARDAASTVFEDELTKGTPVHFALIEAEQAANAAHQVDLLDLFALLGRGRSDLRN